MTDRYDEWRDFYLERVGSWMSLEELRAECGKLTTADAPSTEVLLIHAMHALEWCEQRAAPQQPAARPPKPKECMNGCPDRQVCDHCQWPPGPDQQPAAVNEALRKLEERVQRDEALLRQALEHGAWVTLSGRIAAAAIRERLGIKEQI